MGWIGNLEQLEYTLRIVGADQDPKDGKFLIYNEPVCFGLDGDVVVGQETSYSINGEKANLAGLMNSTSYGIKITVI